MNVFGNESNAEIDPALYKSGTKNTHTHTHTHSYISIYNFPINNLHKTINSILLPVVLIDLHLQYNFSLTEEKEVSFS